MTSPDTQSVRDLVLNAVLRLAPVMVFGYDRDGTCTFSEGAGPGAAGVAAGEVVGRNLFDLYADDPDLVARMRRPLSGETFLATDRIGDRTFDTWYLPLGTDPAGGTSAVGISVDVTERTQALADLGLYRAFVDAAPQFIALARLDGSVLHVNPGGRRMAGIPDGVDVTATSIADYLTTEGLVTSVEVEQPAVVREGRYEGETTLQYWPTGEGIPVRVASFLVTDPATGAPLALATVQSDMREVVAAREAMQGQVSYQRGLLVHLHEAQEAERQRIAGEIHDDTVQVMAAVNLRLQSLRRWLDPMLPPDRVAELDALDRSVRETTGRLRRLLVALDPPRDAGDDILTSLRETARAAIGIPPPALEVDVKVGTEPSTVVRRTLLRIAQEALANVVTHASAGVVEVQLREQPDGYLLRVLDDGLGLADGHDDNRPLHRGVRDMTQRADSVGGTFQLRPRSGGGTIAEALLPHLLGHPEQSVSVGTSRLYLEQTMEGLSEGYTALDGQWRYIFVNSAAYQLLNRDPADSLVGKVLWDEFDVDPEFAAAYRRARDEGVAVQITGHYPPWDKWIENRILPTGSGLSIFGRDVTAERRQSRLVRTGRAVVGAVTGPVGAEDAVRDAVEAILPSWPLGGVRVTGSDGSVLVEVGDLGGSPGRRVDLVVSGTSVGRAELFGEVERVDDDIMQLIALRMAAGLSADRSTTRDGAERVEPESDPGRSGSHGADLA